MQCITVGKSGFSDLSFRNHPNWGLKKKLNSCGVISTQFFIFI